MNFSQFDLWDMLADVIPGAITIILFTSILPRGYVISKVDMLSTSGLPGLFLLIVVCYVIGWIVQATSLNIDDIFTRDTDIWEDQMDELETAQKEDNWNFVRRYYEKCQLFFCDTDCNEYSEIDNEIDKQTLRHLTYNYLNDNNIGRSYRFHILYILSRSLYLIFLLSTIIHISLLVLNIKNIYTPILSFNEELILILFLVWGSYTMWKTRLYMEKSMIKSLMGDFYVSQSN